jgi:hypothetical protein
LLANDTHETESEPAVIFLLAEQSFHSVAAMPTFAYASLVVGDKEASAVAVLAENVQGSRVPFILLYTASSLSRDSIEKLESLSTAFDFILEPVDLDSNACSSASSDDGFGITSQSTASSRVPGRLSRLLIFSAPLWDYEMVCYISPDSSILRAGMDSIFTHATLPTDGWIAAPYLCTCQQASRSRTFSVSDDVSGYHPECPFSNVMPRLQRSMSIAVATITSDRPSQSMLDPGLFVFYPGERSWDRVSEMLRSEADDYLQSALPDQRALVDIFKDRWLLLPWIYHAGPAMAVAHPEIWVQANVICQSQSDSKEPCIFV